MIIDYFKAAKSMQNGGSFAAAISDAYFAADSHNQKILINAFNHLFEKHAHKSEQYILDHIAACAPCKFDSIKQFSDFQLCNIDAGEIVQILIDKQLITFCHESQSYSIV
jgi:hypothetical protein